MCQFIAAAHPFFFVYNVCVVVFGTVFEQMNVLIGSQYTDRHNLTKQKKTLQLVCIEQIAASG